jgi:hypothetical protein
LLLEGWRLFLELSRSPSWRSKKKKFVLFFGLSPTYGQSQADVDRPTLGTQTSPPAVACQKFKNVYCTVSVGYYTVILSNPLV